VENKIRYTPALLHMQIYMSTLQKKKIEGALYSRCQAHFGMKAIVAGGTGREREGFYE